MAPKRKSEDVSPDADELELFKKFKNEFYGKIEEVTKENSRKCEAIVKKIDEVAEEVVEENSRKCEAVMEKIDETRHELFVNIDAMFGLLKNMNELCIQKESRPISTSTSVMSYPAPKAKTENEKKEAVKTFLRKELPEISEEKLEDLMGIIRKKCFSQLSNICVDL